MATPPSWRPLPVSPSAGLPTLLVSTAFTANTYTIHVTDMANIWAESLDRKAIFRRSLNESTVIDPTENDNNMRAFLSKIRSVFDESHQDHDRATLTLSTTPNKNTGDGGLTMNITCQLIGMKPLEWPLYLQKCPQSKLTTELVVPLARANSDRGRHVDSLLEVIRQKDTVIEKLLDKIEASGTRLDNIFTTLTSRQKVTRKTAEERIRGLAPFRTSQWVSEMETEETGISSIFQNVFGATGLKYHPQSDMDDAALDGWWTKAESNIPIVGPESRERHLQAAAAHREDDSDDEGMAKDDDDDAFQVQATPPHLKASRKRTDTNAADHHESTEDEDHVPDSVPAPPPEKKRLGVIGGRRQATPPPPAGSETASDSDDGDAKASKPARRVMGRIGGRSNTPEPKDTEPPKKRVLGRIGGKSPEPPKKVPLGRIGGKIPEPSTDRAGEGSGRQRADPKPQKEQREETANERADRRRAELEKEMQRRIAAGPARKKRKF
ncbi:hypothetical protein CMUS01_05658 [Colletotrichum musicola]|uniref:Non-homologous end-joining factor 1 n=1 Tax=Colletotrichum musicola TaxID=2175873 RepID=A0A8H6NK51_9PEZI|nr:hypothetical protein CMUS01_05658 [Colletotrichum musicola]